MEYYTFISEAVPIGSLIGMMARVLWGGVCIVVVYVLGHYIMGGLRWLWRRGK